MKRIMLFQLAILLIVLFINAYGQNNMGISLPGTLITLPINEFSELSNKRVDTVYAKPKIDAPEAILFNNLNVKIQLIDSLVWCSYSIDYQNVSEESWSIKKLYNNQFEEKFTFIDCFNGDYLNSTDSGYVLLSQKNNDKAKRNLSCKWMMYSEHSKGYRKLNFPLPAVTKGKITIRVPETFTDIEMTSGVLISKKKSGKNVELVYTLSSDDNVEISYALPIIEDVDSTSNVDLKIEDHKESVITAFQQTALFVSDENTIVLNNLNINVLNSPVSLFTIDMPNNFTLLKVEGEGIKKWSFIGSNRIQINLTFELEGYYSLAFLGEMKSDSLISVPEFRVEKAIRQNGIFALALDKNGEGEINTLEGGDVLSVSEYLKKCSSQMNRLLNNQKKSSNDFFLAGSIKKYPFKIKFKIKYHNLIDVASAIVDSGSLITTITDDGKIVTKATYLFKQRNKQFVSLTLPKGCELWSVTLNGRDIVPYIDNDGLVRVALQRFTNGITPQNIIVDFTYFMVQEDISESKKIELKAAVPDCPVNKLSWSLFYPSSWHITSSDGDFKTSRMTILGKKRFELSSDIQKKQYKSMKRDNLKDVFNLGENPEHLYGERILVVNEVPVLKVEFVYKPFYYMIVLICVIVFVCIVTVSGFQIIKQKKTAPF